MSPLPVPAEPDTAAQSSTRPPPWRDPKWVAVGILLICWLGYIHPIAAGKVFFPVDIAVKQAQAARGEATAPPINPLQSDALDQYYPYRVHLAKAIRSREIPLWDAHRLLGAPFSANPETAVWYPPNWLSFTGRILAVFTVIYAASLLATLLLAHWLFRTLGLHPYAASLGAVVFATSGFLSVWRMHPQVLASAMWLPLALVGIETLFRGRALRGVALAASGLALSVLGGHAQTTMYVWIACAVWVIGALLVRWRETGSSISGWLRSLSLGASPFILGTAAALIQILPSVELSTHIIRQHEPYAVLLERYAIPWINALTLLIPDRFGNPVDGNALLGFTNYTETAMYAGTATLGFGAVALSRWRNRYILTFGFLALVGVLVAFGTPVLAVVHAGFPLFTQVGRGVGRAVFLLDVGLAGLAAFGLQQLLNGNCKRLVSWLMALVALLVVAAAFLGQGVADLGATYLAPRVGLALLALVSAAALGRLLGAGHSWAAASIVVVVAIDLWAFGFRYHPFQTPAPIYPVTSEVQALSEVEGERPRFVRLGAWWLPPNAALQHELYDVAGYQSFILTSTVEILSLATDQHDNAQVFGWIGEFDHDGVESEVMRMLGVRSILAPLDAGLEGLTFADRLAIYTREATPAAFLRTCWTEVESAGAMRWMRQASADEWASVVPVEGVQSHPGGAGQRSCPATPGDAVTIERYDNHRIRLGVRAEQPSMLVVTDTWYPGWRATANGTRIPIHRVYGALRGVQLPAGDHEIRMEYRPLWLPVAGSASILSWLMIAVMILGGSMRRRDRSASN